MFKIIINCLCGVMAMLAQSVEHCWFDPETVQTTNY